MRDDAFEQQLHERLELAEQDKRNAVELAEAKLVNGLQIAAADKDAEIRALKAKLEATDVARKLAITEAVNGVERERGDAIARAAVNAKLDNLAANQLAVTPVHQR